MEVSLYFIMSNHRMSILRNLLIFKRLRRGLIAYHTGLPVLMAAFLMFLGSCIKEEFNPDVLDPTLQISPGVAAPIGWVRYQLDEMLTDSLVPDELIINPDDGFISFIYSQDLFSQSANEMIEIPSFVSLPPPITNSTGSPIDLGLIPVDSAITFQDTISCSIPLSGTNGAELDSIQFNTGTITVSAASSHPGMAWQAKIRLPGNATWQITLDDLNPSESDSIYGLTIPVDNRSPGSNEIRLITEFSLLPSSGIIGAGQPMVGFSVSFNSIEWAAIYGYLGQFQIDVGPQSFPVNFFNKLEGGTFHFHQPSLTLAFQNSFGLPLGISMSNFYATGKAGGTTLITGPGVPDAANPRVIGYPASIEAEVPVHDSMVLTPDSTNLFSILETSPTSVTVEVNGTTNPGGPPADNFIRDTDSLSLATKLVLPMEGYADILLIGDTLDFIFNEMYTNTPEEIKQLIFRMTFKHRFPTDVAIQLEFTDDAYLPLDSLFHDSADTRRLVEGSKNFDSDGVAEVIEPDPVEVALSDEQIENISECQYIIVTGRVVTTGAEDQPPRNVKFYSFYYFYAHIGAIVELELNSNEF